MNDPMPDNPSQTTLENTSVDWPTGGTPLDADPDTIRGYGENIATIRGNLQSDMQGPAMFIHGGGEHTMFSTGGFSEGGYAQSLVSRNATECSSFLADLQQNCLAISSAALVIADAYVNGDSANGANLNAVRYAYGDPNATGPNGLPPHITGETISDQQQDNPADAQGDTLVEDYCSANGMIVRVYETADGGTRTTRTDGNQYTQTVEDADGNVVYEVEGTEDGSSTSTTYDENGDPVGTVVQDTRTESADGGGTDHQTITRRYEGEGTDGEPTSETTRHRIEHDDGSTEYYTENEDGEISNERHIGPQPDAQTPEDWVEQMEQDQERAQEQMPGF